jgi:DNA-binding NtrC family response regulator
VSCVATVHDKPEFLRDSALVLRSAGHEVLTFGDSMVALKELERGERLDVLVTRVTFPEGTPNGVSLAQVLRLKRLGLKVIFVARAEREEYTEGVGEMLPHPVDLTRLATMMGLGIRSKSARSCQTG